jgi:phage terminase large subunit-like protein
VSAERLSELKRYEQLQNESRLLFYKPYPKQRLFHKLGVEKRERMMLAGNRVGKTYCAASEIAFHLTGYYPEWWDGLRITKPGRWGIGSKTAELTRDGAQKMLLGPFGRFGTGAIPKAALIDYKLARGIPEAVDIVRVRHASGGVSEAVFKAYADGREKWQADEWQGVWMDEESPEDIKSEASARTAVSSGPIILTLTPLLGMSNVVRQFYPDQGHPDRGLVMMTLEEAEHFDAEKRRKAIESYLPHEREARSKGIPMLGEGAVYQLSEDMITEDPIQAPAWWPRLIAMDFGWHDHPTAAVKAAWDRDNDCVHITALYKQSKQPLAVYAAGIVALGGNTIPVSWPHDGLQHDKSSGEQIAHLYRSQGLKMLTEHAQFPDDRKNGSEAAVWEALARMQTGRLKVDRNLHQWFEEFRSYHRKDGKIVAEFDDLMKATHYLLMMLRFAVADGDAPQKQDRYSRRRGAHGRNTTWLSA